MARPVTMTERERFIATLTFKQPDRVTWNPGHGRRSTRVNWYKQGLPESVTDYHAYIRDLLGIEQPAPFDAPWPGMVLTMMPEFEEKIVEERADSRIVQDWKGNVCEIGKEFMPGDLRGAPDFCTRSWLKCPVESRADWDDMKRRYNPDEPGRFPADFKQNCAKLKHRTHPLGLVFSGPFWQLREWLGFENLCMLFLDDPAMAQDMVDFWQQFVHEMLSRLFEHVVPDYMMINEDMAYKEKPMIGPDMCRKFLSRCWTDWSKLCKQAGVPVVGVDSDGRVDELIPVWIECGMHWNSPLEVAAGNDLPAFRRKYGTRMSYSGGVDKRMMAKGGKALRDEMARLEPVVKAGGFIPSCDHGVPSDVSWPDFVEYSRLLAEMTGWL
ncbi:MAG: hypothetical protein IT440_04020 [Phycisphaeraceae bacterium]|nr:hypothetical protein [Phycisphaeraceae bacterium]